MVQSGWLHPAFKALPTIRISLEEMILHVNEALLASLAMLALLALLPRPPSLSHESISQS